MPSASITAPLAAEWDSTLLEALYGLFFSAPDRELAGVLVGLPPDGTEQDLPLVRAAIPTTQGFAPGHASTFTHETWARVHDSMAHHYRGLETVGWYVSRPGEGTGLTAADIANHARWFPRPDQILLLADSRTHRAAIYARGAMGLVQVSEGPVARRYTRAPRPGFPLAAVSMLGLVGAALGAFAFLVAQAIGG